MLKHKNYRFCNEEITYEKRLPWLGMQSLDIYFENHNIAIEYDGTQHYQPIDYFGGEEYFKIIVERDLRKNKLCEENNCRLFRLKHNYTEEDFDNLITEIKKYVEN